MPTDKQYKERKARGLCVVCGSQADGRVHCEIHRKKCAKYFADIRQHKRAYACRNEACGQVFRGYDKRRFCSRACANKSGDPSEKSQKGWYKRLGIKSFRKHPTRKWTSKSMTPDELRAIGENLYGIQWQTSLARALPVNPRTVRKWLSGKRQMREVIANRIRQMAESAP